MSSPEDLKKRLIAADVKTCIASYVDMHGVSKSKFVPISHFDQMMKGSEMFTGAALDGVPQEIHDADHLSFIQGGGHGGSHPHMVHEFISALNEDRDPWPNAVTAANWTCVGICAHESSTKGGEIVRLPEFTLK